MKNAHTKSIFYFILAAILCLILFESLLHYYNPNRSRVRNGKILLPVNQSYVYKNNENSKIGKHIIHTKNSLGFRGPEIPAHFSDYLSIVTVGGSTTECFYLSDSETWPFLVEQYLKKSHDKVWLNNAGLDGFSTFGISILVNDYISRIKPDYILFLLGSNDIGMDAPSNYDAGKMKQSTKIASFMEWIKRESEILDFMRVIKKRINDLRRPDNIDTRNFGYKPLDLNKMPHGKINDKNVDALLSTHRRQFIPGYKERISNIIRTCRNYGIRPVLITQPILAGEGIDKTTNVNLETIIFDNGNSGFMEWKLMELYNNTLREYSVENNVDLIDLANIYPKDSKYFYDKSHFGIEGAKLAAVLIGNSLEEVFSSQWQPH